MSSEALGLTVKSLLLRRRGVVFLPDALNEAPRSLVEGIELELAELGYVVSRRLRVRLARQTAADLIEQRAWLVSELAALLGADQRHTPLFRRFPHDVPADTRALWWKKVLVHYVQAPEQPCLFCGAQASTHVLSPCEHVVCEACFDGASYSACPVCEHHVNPSSPFFVELPERELPKERVTFRLLDLAEDEAGAARGLFVGLCERKQALSPDDRQALVVVVRERGDEVLNWLPEKIPVRENVAIVFGTLFQVAEPERVLPVAARYLSTATDVLRLIAVLSGTDGSLQAETIIKSVDVAVEKPAILGKLAAVLGFRATSLGTAKSSVVVRVKRFKVARLRRSLRRALLGLLEALDPERLVEDMLRHRSYWVWVGEFLHPTEYAARFPHAAAGFEIVRGKAPDGRPAPTFRTWAGRLERAIADRDIAAMLSTLRERPGELARRFDRALRIAGADPVASKAVVAAFVDNIGAFATPVLLALRSHLSTRARTAPVRVYWPKGRVAKGVSSPDTRAPLAESAIRPAVAAIGRELLRRFSAKPAFDVALVDEPLAGITVPFNERTTSSAAVALPRGSRVAVPAGKIARLFLHWCQPQTGGDTTDLDLSVGFYDEQWKSLAVCSFFQLQAQGTDGRVLASSAGDLRDGPWPEGATELVDVDSGVALASGVRYAVMVVNNYAGMPFSRLERGFAGLMLRDDPEGRHFDPRTVELKFTLAGENGVFLPLVLDVRENVLHWLDVQSKGQLAFNNVESSNQAITKICPELMTYFGSGARPSMLDLALLHAAARCRTVIVRGPVARRFTRRDDEDVVSFHERLARDDADERGVPAYLGPASVFAVLFRGDIDLPSGSASYALFREQVTPTLAASDLLT